MWRLEHLIALYVELNQILPEHHQFTEGWLKYEKCRGDSHQLAH